MTEDELLISFVQAMSRQLKTQVALCWDPKQRKVLGFGVPGESFEPAIIASVMFKRDEDKNRGFRVYASYKPMEMDIGMAWRADVGAIYFVDGNAAKRLNTTKPLNTGYAVKEGLKDDKEKEGGHVIEDVGGAGPILETGSGAIAKTKWIFAPPNAVDEFLKKLAGSKDQVVKQLFDAAKKPNKGRESFLEVRGLIKSVVDSGIYPPGKYSGAKLAPDLYYSRLVYALVCRAWVEKEKRQAIGSREYGNNIGCVLTDKDDRLIAWGLNFKSKNPNYHAETLMLQEYLHFSKQQKLPEGCTMYTSLESCYMCAAFFAEVAPKGRCIYLHEDPQVPNSALKRSLNGVTQHEVETIIKKITPELAERMGGLKSLQDFEKSDTITFLFGSKARDKYAKETKEGDLHRQVMGDIVKRAIEMRKSKNSLSKEEEAELGETSSWLVRHISLFLDALKGNKVINTLL